MPDLSRPMAHLERRATLDELGGRPADASQRGGVPDRGDHASTGPVKLRSSRASDQFSAFPDAQGTPSDNNGLVPPPLPGAAGQPAIPVRSASAPARLHGIRSPEGAVIDTTRSSCLVSGMALDEALLGWLLDTDPALRWQVERDLAKERDVVWAATRTRVAAEGMGARLLELQDGDGQWAGGAYFPSRADPRAVNHPDDGEGQPYTATTWSLNTLREWGVDASVLAGTAEKLTVNSRWEYDDLPYWGGEVDCCINAYTLANGAWLGADVSGLVEWFVEHQLPDGGWNCDWVEGRAGRHSTPRLTRCARSCGSSRRSAATTHCGRRGTAPRSTCSSGGCCTPSARVNGSGAGSRMWTTPSAGRTPPCARWTTCARPLSHDDVAPDPRAGEAVTLVRSARGEDGRWLQGTRYKGQVWFEVDVPVGEPSPWLTFYATRVLDWWDNAQPSATRSARA